MKKKEESYKIPENFTFRLNMVEIDHECSEEACRETFQEFRGDYPICAYEKYLYAYYMWNAGIDILALYSEDLVSKSFYCDAVTWLKKLTHSFIHNNPVIRKYTQDKLEVKLNKIPELRKMIEQQYKEEGYVCLSSRVVVGMPKYTQIIQEHIKNLLDELKVWLRKQDESKLQKSFYIHHLHCFLKLAGIKGKIVKRIAEYMLLQQNTTFKQPLFSIDYKDNETPIRLTGSDKFNMGDLLKYSNILFKSTIADGYETKTKDSKFLLNRFVYMICFTQTTNEKVFYERCLPAMKKTDLTVKDFQHIEQVPYLLTLLENALKEKRKGVNILLYGKPGTGKTALAKVLIQSVTKDAYEVLSTQWTGLFEGRFLKTGDDINNNRMRTDNFMLIRQILKKNSKGVILYDEAEDFFRKKNETDQPKGFVNNILENNINPTVWTTNNLNCMEESYFRRFTYVLNIEELPKDIYEDMLDKLAYKYNLDIDDETRNICMQYKPNLGLLDKTFSNFQLSGYDDQECLRTDILDALKGQNYGEDLPVLSINKFNFNPDLINASIDLKELTKQIKKNGRLDFGMLLYGVPGSSKSSYGRYLAEQLGLKVINKNYTELASMWVGETEHNIANLFKEGTRDQAVIILDEADVLLRDRTKARASWEVSQTEALLTEMEKYEYPFIMTTNLFEDLDMAVMRRFLYKVKHGYLKVDQVKLAFKHFFGINIKEDLHLSRLTSGDFALVKKQAEFQGKLKDKSWLIDRLTEEMNQKKDILSSPAIHF